MKIPDAAKALGRSEHTIRNWVSSGLLRAKKIGRHWDVPNDEIERVNRDGLSLEKEK